MSKFKTNDEVIVIAGKDKGKKGKILKINYKKKVLYVEKCGIIKKHTKQTKESKGGIIEIEGPLDFSNIMLICPKSKKPAKVVYTVKSNKKSREFKVLKREKG